MIRNAIPISRSLKPLLISVSIRIYNSRGKKEEYSTVEHSEIQAEYCGQKIRKEANQLARKSTQAR
jgi:hypothetical protein